MVIRSQTTNPVVRILYTIHVDAPQWYCRYIGSTVESLNPTATNLQSSLGPVSIMANGSVLYSNNCRITR